MASTAAPASLKGIHSSHLERVTASPDTKIVIVHTQWNKEIVNSLVEGCMGELVKLGVRPAQIHVLAVSAIPAGRHRGGCPGHGGWDDRFCSISCRLLFLTPLPHFFPGAGRV